MASTNDATINAFYLAYYGRPADPAGLAYWSEALATSNGDFSSIVSAFATSAEATAHLGGGTATDQISTIYQQLFGHAPDAAGLAYWSDAISSGNMTLAEAAIQITNGAQSSDSTVSTLRQEVAAQFTATVAASGVAYDGDAAVAAARVLISAVNANTSATDITALISAGSSLVQTAHDNPAIITAMANGGDLSTLLSTASGQSDPVALVQALASIGKAALTDPTGLTTLLHGGGVAGLIASLPAGTSLTDVATAVNTGGLAAGTTVATTPVDTTPVDTTPPAAPKLQLVQDTGFNTTDGITGNGKIQISGLENGSTWQYSNDGGLTWTTGTAATKGVAILQTNGFGDHVLEVRSTDAAGNTSAISTLKYDLEGTIGFQGPDGASDLPTAVLATNSNDNFVAVLHGGASLATSVQEQISTTGLDGSWANGDSDDTTEGTYYFRYIFTDAAGKTSTTNALEVIVNPDQALTATASLVAPANSSNGNSYWTTDGHVQIDITDPNAKWVYSTDNGNTWNVGTDTGVLNTAKADGYYSVMVRAYETVGDVTNYSASTIYYTVDTVAPAQGLKLLSVEGETPGTTHTDRTQADAVFSYTGTLDINNGDAFFYTVNGGDWIRADATMIDTVNKTVTIADVDLSTKDATIVIQTVDAAGNKLDLTQTIDGPATTFKGSTAAAGFILKAADNDHIFLTDGATVTEVFTTTGGSAIANTNVVIGAQAAVAEGIIGVGPSAEVHSNGNASFYGLGTNGDDVVKGQYVWGFDGDDTITALGTSTNAAGNISSIVYGGNGADKIDATAGGSEFVYSAAQESNIVADDTVAHGFDTITVNTTSDTSAITHNQIFNFSNNLDGFSAIVSGSTLTGSETGNELLAMINTAVGPNLQHNGTIEAEFVTFHVQGAADVNFLVEDANGDGLINGSDFVIKIVGTIDVEHSFNSAPAGGGTVILSLPTA